VYVSRRYEVIEILIRVDIDGPPHENPDGTEVLCPHIHLYREGYGDKWAQPLPPAFADPTDLAVMLRDYLRFCNVEKIPSIQKLI
jgi:hypothetical protein